MNESVSYASESAEVVDRVTAWAVRRADVVGLLLVGSYARGAARPDSDVDFVLLTDDELSYVDNVWVGELALGELVRTRSWGPIVERRFVTPSGLEVEVNIGAPSWAAVDPVDPGTRRVVTDGACILHEKTGAMSALVNACR